MNFREALLSIKEIVERFGDSRAVHSYYFEFGRRLEVLELPLLSLLLSKILNKKALFSILLISLAVGLLFNGNWLIMPKIK
jgi:hypothetical protein